MAIIKRGLRAKPKRRCSVCGEREELTVFKGKTLCRDCLCEDTDNSATIAAIEMHSHHLVIGASFID